MTWVEPIFFYPNYWYSQRSCFQPRSILIYIRIQLQRHQIKNATNAPLFGDQQTVNSKRPRVDFHLFTASNVRSSFVRLFLTFCASVSLWNTSKVDNRVQLHNQQTLHIVRTLVYHKSQTWFVCLFVFV